MGSYPAVSKKSASPFPKALLCQSVNRGGSESSLHSTAVRACGYHYHDWEVRASVQTRRGETGGFIRLKILPEPYNREKVHKNSVNHREIDEIDIFDLAMLSPKLRSRIT